MSKFAQLVENAVAALQEVLDEKGNVSKEELEKLWKSCELLCPCENGDCPHKAKPKKVKIEAKPAARFDSPVKKKKSS